MQTFLQKFTGENDFLFFRRRTSFIYRSGRSIMNLFIFLSFIIFSFTSCFHQEPNNLTITSDITLKKHTGEVLAVKWSPDGKYLATSSSDTTIQVWKAYTWDLILNLTGHKKAVSSISWSPDGKYLVSGSLDTTLKVWEIPSGNFLTEITIYAPIYMVDWSPNEKYVAVSSQYEKNKSYIETWNIFNGKRRTSISYYNLNILPIAWNPIDEENLAYTKYNRILYGKFTLEDSELYTIKGFSGEIQSMAWNTNGESLAAADENHLIRIWNTSSKEEFPTVFSGHTDTVNSINFDPYGYFMASGSADKTIKIWSANKNKLMTSVTAHKDSINSLSWSPDRKLIASGSNDKTVKIWQVVYEHPE